MKKNKLYLIASLIACTIMLSFGSSSAQVGVLYSTIPSAVGGAVGGADTTRTIGTTPTYLYYKLNSNSSKAASVQVSYTRRSASMGGTFSLQYSNDGVNYGTTQDPNAGQSDTITVTNGATFTQLLTIPASFGLPYQYVRLRCTGASGDTASVKAFIYTTR
jgi:hypothetical protein